eukprot:CAMPEP_0197424134 /NCGR_PEP_ID=MMETSP1170-20131217/24893_1 /TAXON_ID=54406 /ORGANISM="Sarcinochrysis sp, Strain CCMP770" /LENGTH=38 /DNA_ID= /DNA_START= /DNA_END= /DNA_ORIENTATION=
MNCTRGEAEDGDDGDDAGLEAVVPDGGARDAVVLAKDV